MNGLCLLEDVPSNIANDVERVGVIYYTFIKGRLYMCLGRDRQTKELSDFGGGRKYGESVHDAAVRESCEESRNAFLKFQSTSLLNSLCIYNNRMIIVLCRVINLSGNIMAVSSHVFNRGSNVNKKNIGKREYNEMESLVWLCNESIMKLMNCTSHFVLWSRVRIFLENSHIFSDLSILKYILDNKCSISLRVKH